MTTPVLRRGSRHPAVARLRELFATDGIDAPPTGHPWIFDGRLGLAVREYQQAHIGPSGRPLAVDGVVGPLTWWSLTTEDQSDTTKRARRHTPSLPRTGGTDIGREALCAALAEHSAGAREEGGNNRGRWVSRYLDGRVPEPANWCAGFVSWCIRRACWILEVPMPIEYTLGARDLLRQLREKGTAYSLDEREPEPGDVVVWWRGRRDSWMGHVGLVHHASHGVLWTVEGNRGGYPAPVALYDYPLSRVERLLGFGQLI